MGTRLVRMDPYAFPTCSDSRVGYEDFRHVGTSAGRRGQLRRLEGRTQLLRVTSRGGGRWPRSDAKVGEESYARGEKGWQVPKGREHKRNEEDFNKGRGVARVTYNGEDEKQQEGKEPKGARRAGEGRGGKDDGQTRDYHGVYFA